jgi:hypothetical protein
MGGGDGVWVLEQWAVRLRSTQNPSCMFICLFAKGARLVVL